MIDIYVAVSLIALSLAAVIVLAILRPSLPDDEPHAERAANPNLPPADTCMVQGCHEEFVSSINGWRECASHLAARKAV